MANFIEVELPDGTIAEFPDTMSNDDIQNVLSRQFPTEGGQVANPYLRAVDDALKYYQGLAANVGRGATLGWSDELVGMLAGEQAAEEQRKFTSPKENERLQSELKEIISPIHSFLIDCSQKIIDSDIRTLEKDIHITRKELYKIYTDWTIDTNSRTASQRKFATDFKNILSYWVEDAYIRGMRGYIISKEALVNFKDVVGDSGT